MTKLVAHVHSMSVFDCPRVRYVREASGTLTIYLGKITIHVFGNDPYKEPPFIVEQTEEDAARETLRGYMTQTEETAREGMARELAEAERVKAQADREE